jgi:hypothetical protein
MAEFYPIFLSVVIFVRNQANEIESLLTDASNLLSNLVCDYELIVVDKASEDDSNTIYQKLTCESGLPNIQVYALTREVDDDTASWVGLENALGDFVAVIDPQTDSIKFLPDMLDRAVSGADIVFATNKKKTAQTLAYRLAYVVFNRIYQSFGGFRLSDEAPHYRILSKRVVNFLLQHSQPALAYRQLPAMGGFSRAKLKYSHSPKPAPKKRLFENIDRGMRLLISTTRAPMRLVTSLSLFGAIANLIYSIYVVVVVFLKEDVADGWASLSLQQSGMFFLISLVLLVLGEYILTMARLSNEGPLYHIGQEFTSARMTRREKLNIEETDNAETHVSLSDQTV